MIRHWILTGSCLLAASCNGVLEPPTSLGDKNSGYSYIAIDPLPVAHSGFAECTSRTRGGTPDLLDGLHHYASRISTRLISGEAGAKAGPVTVGTSGNTYELVQDFIAYDETNLRFKVAPGALARGKGVTVAEERPVARLMIATESSTGANDETVVPVYVGVGLRLTAIVTVLKGNVGLEFGAISGAARAERVRGSLVVQTLGVNGPKIITLMPLPGELNATTVQNAAVALGAIKALLYSDDTGKAATVVGIHYPYPEWDPAKVNAIVTALAGTPIPWKPCEPSGQSN
jgi:hypothetical protein